MRGRFPWRAGLAIPGGCRALEAWWYRTGKTLQKIGVCFSLEQL